MKPRAYTALTILLISAPLLLALAAPAYPQENASYALTHEVRVTDHGFLAVEETVEYRNLGASPINLQPFELIYPSVSAESISKITVEGPIGLDTEKTGTDGATRVRVTPQGDHQIQAGASATIRIRFYLSNHVDISAEGAVLAELPLVPSMDRPVEVHSRILVPSDAEVGVAPAGFEVVDELDAKVLSGVFQNVEPGAGETESVGYSRDPAVSFAILEFPNAVRTFRVSNDGTVTVRDELTVINRGGLTASTIELTLIGAGVTAVDIVPIEEPPLTNRFTIGLQDGKLDLFAAYSIRLSRGEEFVFGIEYPLPAGESRSVDGAVSYQVPVKPPIDGVVGRLSYEVETAPGVAVSGGENVTYEDAAPSEAEIFGFGVGLTLAWASGGAIPVATVLFVAVLVSLLSGRLGFRRAEKSVEAVPGVEEFVSVFEEKTGAVDEMLESFQRERRGGVAKGRFAESKRYFDTLKGRSAGRIGGLRSKIVSAKPHLKDRLVDLSNIDREYNRAVLDLLNLYEQYHTGRIREETFGRLHGRYQKRLTKARDRLNEGIEYLHSEIEK